MDYLREAIGIVTAQAAVRAMQPEEIESMIRGVAAGIKNVIDEPAEILDLMPTTAQARASIKEGSIVCLECGKKFKIMTAKHLLGHGLTPDQYKAKYGLPKSQALACKALARARRARMKDMRLWETRRKPAA